MWSKLYGYYSHPAKFNRAQQSASICNCEFCTQLIDDFLSVQTFTVIDEADYQESREPIELEIKSETNNPISETESVVQEKNNVSTNPETINDSETTNKLKIIFEKQINSSNAKEILEKLIKLFDEDEKLLETISDKKIQSYFALILNLKLNDVPMNEIEKLLLFQDKNGRDLSFFIACQTMDEIKNYFAFLQKFYGYKFVTATLFLNFHKTILLIRSQDFLYEYLNFIKMITQGNWASFFSTKNINFDIENYLELKERPDLNFVVNNPICSLDEVDRSQFISVELKKLK